MLNASVFVKASDLASWRALDDLLLIITSKDEALPRQYDNYQELESYSNKTSGSNLVFIRLSSDCSPRSHCMQRHTLCPASTLATALGDTTCPNTFWVK